MGLSTKAAHDEAVGTIAGLERDYNATHWIWRDVENEFDICPDYHPDDPVNQPEEYVEVDPADLEQDIPLPERPRDLPPDLDDSVVQGEEFLHQYPYTINKAKTFQFTRRTVGPDREAVRYRTTINLDNGKVYGIKSL